jgi:transcriptional regulator with XRE-family HTH domain
MNTLFRDTLRKVIEEKGLLGKEVSKISGIEKRTIDKWVSKTKPTIPNVYDAYAIARALGTTVEYLVTGEEPLIILPPDRRLLEKARRYRPVIDDLEYLDVQLRNALIIAIASTAETCRKQHTADSANA